VFRKNRYIGNWNHEKMQYLERIEGNVKLWMVYKRTRSGKWKYAIEGIGPSIDKDFAIFLQNIGRMREGGSGEGPALHLSGPLFDAGVDVVLSDNWRATTDTYEGFSSVNVILKIVDQRVVADEVVEEGLFSSDSHQEGVDISKENTREFIEYFVEEMNKRTDGWVKWEEDIIKVARSTEEWCQKEIVEAKKRRKSVDEIFGF